MATRFYLFIEDERHGPFGEDELLDAGMRRGTLVWFKGCSDWTRAEDVPQLRRLFKGSSGRQKTEREAIAAKRRFDRPPGQPVRRRLDEADQVASTHSWARAFYLGGLWIIVFGLICLLLAAVCEIQASRAIHARAPDQFWRDWTERSILASIGAGVLGMPLLIVGAISYLVLLYRCWALLVPAPGATVGLLFVPFFNLYWIFVAIAGLVKELNRAVKENNSGLPTASQPLGSTISVYYVLGAIPFLGLLPAVFNVFVVPAYFRSVYRTAASLHGDDPYPGEPAGRTEHAATTLLAAVLAPIGLWLVVAGILSALGVGRFSLETSLFLGALGITLLGLAMVLARRGSKTLNAGLNEEDEDFERSRRRQETRRRTSRAPMLFVGAIIAIVATGMLAVLGYFFFGETNQDVIDRYTPQYAAKRAQLPVFAAKLPPVGSVKTTGVLRKELNPPPVYDNKSRTYNMSIVMFDQLFDPDLKFGTPARFDLGLYESRLLTHLNWTGPRSVLAVKRNRARPDLARELEETLEHPYLLIVRSGIKGRSISDSAQSRPRWISKPS